MAFPSVFVNELVSKFLKFQERVLPNGWVITGKRVEAIPLVAFDLYRELDIEARIRFCDALVAEVYLPAPVDNFDKINSIEFGHEVFEDVPLPYVKNHNTSQKQIKIKRVIPETGPFRQRGHTNTWYFNFKAYEFRPKFLILKLRLKLEKFRNLRRDCHFINDTVYRPTALPEMDSNEGPSESVVTTSNVVLGETQSESFDLADKFKKASWYELSSTEENPNYANLTDRFTLWQTLTWKEGSTIPLLEESLPAAFINSYPREKMPMFIPFHIHQYFRGDIEIKIQINSNKFQAGQLICFWHYGAQWDSIGRIHIASAVQLPHVLISAGASNEATLTIPFRYYLAYVHTKKREGYPDPLHIGSLIIRPMVPLSVSTTGSKECLLSIFIRFVNSSFTGLVDGSVNPEMDVVGTLVKDVLPAIGGLLNAPNCDNPPLNESPKYLVPTASHSWSIGNGIVEPLHRLCLQNSMGFRHADDTAAEDLHYTSVINKFGLLRIIKWDSSDAALNSSGSLLWSCNVHPQVDKHLVYTTNNNTGELTLYFIPPCGVISSLFEYWRGSLEFKFDIVATSFHTGRLLVAYIPGISSQNKITLEQARNSAHVVFSLQDSSSFTFNIPFISDRPWWKRKYGGPQRRSESLSPSALFMFVLNPLIPMESVSKVINIVPYVRAGKDFEFAVPVQPAIGLDYDTRNIAPSQVKVNFKPGYFPVYVGAWHAFYDSKKCIIRYGNVSDHIAQVNGNPQSDSTHVYVWRPNDVGVQFRYSYEGGSVMQGKILYGVILSDGGYNYMIPFPDQDNAIKTAWAYKLGYPISSISKYIPNYVQDGVYSSSNMVWTGSEHINPFAKLHDYAWPEMERENAPNVMSPTVSLRSTQHGLVTFGENFSDLKDLLRRYQLYWDGVVTAPTSAVRDYALLQLPITPTGLDLDINVNRPMWNSAREGHIPIIGSGYRYFRGGIRFKIVVSNYDGIVWIQYRPDRPLDYKRQAKTGTSIMAADRYRNHSYPFYVQDMSVNRVIECEIPYYQPGVFGICGKLNNSALNNDMHNFTSLGDLVIGVEGSVIPKDMQVAVYYSVADDFSFNTYIGFPPMVYSDETAFPEMEFATGMVSSIAGSLFGKAVSTPVKKNLQAIKQRAVEDIVAEVQKKVSPMLNDLQDVTSDGANQICSALSEGVLKQTLVNSIGQFMQVLINPSPASLAIALCALVGSLVVVSFELILKLQALMTEFLQSVWHKYFVPASDLQEAERTACPEGLTKEEKDHNVSMFAMIFGFVSATVGLSVRRPTNWPSLTKGMKDDLGLVNNATVFFKNSIDAIVYCYEYCLGEMSDVSRAKRIVEKEYPAMEAWTTEVLDLLDARRRRLIFKSSRQANRVFDACHYGSLLIKANIDKSCPGGKILFDLYNKICKLRDDLVEGGNHPNVRFEPFSFYMVGKQGIGKSYLTAEICKEMLHSINYQSSEQMIYWLQLGQKYWNGIGNPAVVARDEAYAVDGQFTDEEIQVHMAMCSSSVFNPPMAAVEEKNKRINPLIYYMNSNVQFPTFTSARCPAAIYRRRKMLVSAQFTSRILAKYPNIIDASQIAPEDRVDKKHLEFFIAENASDVDTKWLGPYTFKEFISITKSRFSQHYEQEKINFRQRMRDNYCLDPNYDDTDDMEFVAEVSQSGETLKERFERDKLRYQDVIDEAELETNSYIKSMIEKAKSLYRRVLPEVDFSKVVPGCSDELNRVQKGFYSEDRREQIRMLVEKSLMDVGAVQKILSGTDIDRLLEEDVAGFMFCEDFLPLIDTEEFRYKYWVGTEHSAIIRIRGSQTYGASEIAHSDREILGRWSKQYLPHWNQKSGTEAIRCRLYWLMRQAQWMEILSKYDLDTALADMRQYYKDRIYDHELDSVSMSDLEASSEPRMAQLFSDLEQVKKIERMQILMTYLKKTGMSRKVCEHCKVWCENIHDLSKLKFNRRQNKIIYTDAIGLEFTVNFGCNCGNYFSKLWDNKLFKRSMRIVWQHDHSDTDSNELDPFRFDETEELKEDVKNWLVSLKDWFSDWWQCSGKPMVNAILKFIRNHILSILSVIIGTFVIYKSCTSYSPVKKFCGGFVGTQLVVGGFRNAYAESSPNYYRDSGVGKRPKVFTAPVHRESGIMDVNVEQKLLDNVCFIRCRYSSGDKMREISGRCLGIRNRQVLVIKHYFEEFEMYKDSGRFQLILMKRGKESLIELKYSDFKNIRYLMIGTEENSSNYGILELPKFCPMFKNILGLFPTAGMHKNVRAEADFLSVNGPTKRAVRIEQADYLRIASVSDTSEIVLDAVYYYAHHGAGLCGSILLSDSVNNGNPGILGLHVAGRNGIGYAEPLCREWFDTAPPKEEIEYVDFNINSTADSDYDIEGNVLLYGCVDTKFAHKESGKSRIIPSLLHGQVYDVKTEVNPLRPDDPRQPPGSDPLRDGCNKHGMAYPGRFDEDIVSLVSVDNREILINKCKPTMCELKPLTLQQAVCGDVNIPSCEALNWNSSEGFPLSAYRPKNASNKKWLFDLEETSDGMKLLGLAPKLRSILEVRKILREQNRNQPPIYVDCLKDYRLTPEKCKIPGKTRIFSIAPVQTTIDVRKYMGIFLSSYKEATIDAEHGIGINVDSMQWTKLATYLTQPGTSIVTGDYSNFGPTLTSQLVVEVLEDILYWHEYYGASESHLRHLRRILMDEILMPIHLCGNVVYQPLNGIGSGSPITAELNSEVNKYYVKYAWIKIMRQNKPDFATMDLFHKHCRLVTYGDDFIMGVSDVVKDIFNCKTISGCLREYGICLTSASKDARLGTYEILESSTFLKRGFKKHPVRAGIYLAPIETQSVTECLNWCHKSNNIKEATQEVVRASFDLAYGHGPKFYSQHQAKVNKALSLHGLDVDLKDWHTRDKEIFG